MNHEESTSSMVTTRMETTHGLTCSVARVIEVIALQSVDTICLCCLTQFLCGSHWTLISSDYCDGGAHVKKWLVCCHLSIQSLHDLQCVLDQPVCSMLCIIIIAR